MDHALAQSTDTADRLTAPAKTTDGHLQISDLHFAYADKTILAGIDLSVPKGSLIAIMGGSGCGKTTLLRTIAGQLIPQNGTVTVNGQVINRLSRPELYAYRKRVGMLFQFGALFTDLSVFENVAFPLREHGDLPESIIRDLVLLKLEAVGLRGAAHLSPRALSGGMARRVALARAIALDPMLMLYDEPFTGLDPISLSITGELIRDLNHALGATSVMVTHDVAESFAIVDYVYFLSGGKVIASGSPAEMRASNHPYVHQFIHGKRDGPVAFHYPAPAFADSLCAPLPT